MDNTAATITAKPIGTMNAGLISTLFLVLLADYLTITAAPGIGWFVFALVSAITIAAPALNTGKQLFLSVAISIMAALPLMEAPSLLGGCIALLGLIAGALLASGLLPTMSERIPGVIVRFVALLPFCLIADGRTAATHLDQQGLWRQLLRQAVSWIVPLTFVGIFCFLFAAANPVIDFALEQFQWGDVAVPAPMRLLSWLVFAAVLWGLFRPRLLPERKPATIMPLSAPRESMLFGRTTILRSLVIFNLVFAIQTALDLTYLWGGVALPDGLSYADYAHRGAFPLIVTILLAAGFVLAAMRRDGPGMHSALIRRLVYLWIGQNVLLCISAMLRLELYVEVYSLTELRIFAGIWMGLVAVGLLLILLRIALRRSNAWLVATNLLSLVVTLYGCAWIDFSALIARFNIEHSRQLSGSGAPLDLPYLRTLGPTVIPALDDYMARVGGSNIAGAVREELTGQIAGTREQDWRSWSWRDHRLELYLDSVDGNDDNHSTIVR